MGCGYPPKTLERALKLEKEKEIDSHNNNHDILFLLYQKLEILIEKNPFYDISLTYFENIFVSIKNNLDDKNKNQHDYNNEIIDEIIKAFYNDGKNYIKELYKKVINYALINYNFGLDQEQNNNLIEILIELIFVFLTNNQKGKKDMFRKNLIEILKNIKQNKDDNNKYMKENIFNLIINLVEIHTFFFVVFFLYFTFSEVIINEYNNYEKIINEDSAINNINTFVESNLNKINTNISTNYINILIISEINNKINNCFEDDNEEDIISLDENKINLISDSIYEIININNYVKFIFFGENHDF